MSEELLTLEQRATQYNKTVTSENPTDPNPLTLITSAVGVNENKSNTLSFEEIQSRLQSIPLESQETSSQPKHIHGITHQLEIDNKQAPGVPQEQELHRQSIHELKIAVHTLWGGTGNIPKTPLQRYIEPILHRDAYKKRQAVHALRKKVFDYTVESFSPERKDDVFLYMPWVGKKFADLRHTVKDFHEQKIIDKNVLFWTDLFNAIKAKSPSRNNVVLGPDLVYDYNDPTVLTDKLAKNNYEISEETNITIGGEYLDLCMQAASNVILKLPQVKRLRVDKRASLQQDYDKGKPLVTDMLKQNYEQNGFVVSEDVDYVYVSKSK